LSARPLYAVDAQHSPTDELPPEAWFISSLLDSGHYVPSRYGISGEYVLAYRPVHEFAIQYQESTGGAPPLHLIKEKFPRFPYVPRVSIKWASEQVHQQYTLRVLRRALAAQGSAIVEENISAARQVMMDTLIATADDHQQEEMINAWSPPVRVSDEANICVPVIEGTLQEATGGHQAGHLWIIGGIPGEGKTYRLVEHAVLACEAGWDVVFYSMEMRPEEVQKRLQIAVMVGRTSAPYGSDEFDRDFAKVAYDMGRCYVGRPKHALTAARVGDRYTEGTLVVIDYIAQMRPNNPKAATGDHRDAALVTSELHDVALACKAPILTASQFNRDGYDSDKPSMRNTAGTKAVNEYADVYIGLRRQSETVVANHILKNRHGIGGQKFYTRFIPGESRSHQISFDEATEAIYRDTEAEKGIDPS
jgi:hypothetical protein